MKFSQLRLPARASVFYTLSALIGRGTGLLFTPIFTRILSEEAYGIYNLYTSWIGIFTILSTLEIGGAVYMRSMQKSSDRPTLLRSACVLEFVLISLICTLYFAFYPYSSAVTGLSVFISSAMFVQIFLNSLINLYLCYSKFSYDYRKVFLINVITGCAPILLSLILIKLFRIRLYAKILSQLLISLAVFLPLLYIIFKGKKNISIKSMLPLLRSGLSHFPHYISIALISRADKLFIASAYGEATLAKYSVADTVGSLLLFAMTAPLSALTPWILRKVSSGENYRIAEVSDVALRIIGWLSLILLGFAPEIMSFLAPSAYGEALFVAYPIAVSAIPYLAFFTISSALSHRGGIAVSLPSVIGGAGALLFSYIFSKGERFTLLSLVIPLSYLIMLTLGSALCERRGLGGIIKLSRAFILTLFTALLAFSLYLIRDNLPLRIFAVILFTVPLVFDLGRGTVLVRE